MRLLLIRHGQTPNNVAGELGTRLPGPSLTELGRQQAAAIPEALAAQGVQHVFASPARRAQETAAPLAADLGIETQTAEDAYEVQAGSLELSNDPADIKRYLETLFAWCVGDLAASTPQGETGNAFLERYDRAVAQVLASGATTAALISHGAAIRVWTTVRAGNLAPGFARANPLGNTGVVELAGDPKQGWLAHAWMGAALGGPGVDDGDPFDGPAGVPL